MADSARNRPSQAGRAEPVIAYIGLGSNQGDSQAILRRAVDEISALAGVRVTAASSLYLTEPQGDADQPFFLNQVVRAECSGGMEPGFFLRCLQDIENSLGRKRDPARRFGPRPVDLDLLLFGNARMNTGRLVLPHPRMLERAFVLVPLAEIAPGLVLPGDGAGDCVGGCTGECTVEEALDRLNCYREGNRIYQKG